jgi:26S proteasome regulatory subunit N6
MAPSATVSQRIEEAKALSTKDPPNAKRIYGEILSQGPGSTDAALREYEAALVGLGELYRDARQSQELAELVKASRGAFSSFAKAKTAKLGKHLYSNGPRDFEYEGASAHSYANLSPSTSGPSQRDPKHS